MVSVAILADAPTLTTGFGRTTSRMATSLTHVGYDLAVFGLKARPADTAGEHGYEIWPAEQGGHWTESLPAFFEAVAADVLIMNMDAYNALECVDACADAGWRGPTVSYVCFDGLPIDGRHLDAQRRCAAIWPTSHTGAAFLRSRGVEVTGVAAPGVDLDEFQPHPDPARLRTSAGWAMSTMIGVFATNTERKQLARAVDGFALARDRLPDDSCLYMHCRREGYWDITARATAAGIADRVLFAGGAGFDERRALSELAYVDRLRMCDIVVNVPHSGDIEQIILEAQACEVPLLHTADGGVMSEAVAGGGILLPADAQRTGRCGQTLQFVSPATIADAMVRVAQDPDLARRLRAAGRENVEGYGWDTLELAAQRMVEPFVEAVASG